MQRDESFRILIRKVSTKSHKKIIKKLSQVKNAGKKNEKQIVNENLIRNNSEKQSKN